MLIDGYVADVNLERHLLTNWFKVSRIYAIVCSSLSATRFAILYDNDFVEYDCQQRDSIVSGIMHHLEGKSVRIYLGDIHMCRILLDGRVVALSDSNFSISTTKFKRSDIFQSHRAAAEGIFIRKIASMVVLQAQSEGTDLGAAHYVIVDSARCFASNCEANGVTSFEDRHALINCMSILAQQINATSFVDGAKDAVFLMQAFELLLSSIESFESFLDIPNVVVMINRFFRVLSAAGQEKSATTSLFTNGVVDEGPARSLLICHIIQMLKRMVIFADGSLQQSLTRLSSGSKDNPMTLEIDNSGMKTKTNEKRRNSVEMQKENRIDQVEKHRREELMSFQRIKICVQLLSISCSTAKTNGESDIETNRQSKSFHTYCP